MSRRGRDSAAFSLFAFQDIITSVTGIMILVTLILALELIHRKETSPERKTQQIVTEIQTAVSQVGELESWIAELKDKLEQGAKRIGEVARFDAPRVRAQVADLTEFNTQVTSDLARLAKEQQDALRRQQEAKQFQEQRADDPQTIQQLHVEIKKKLETLAKLRKSKRVIFNPTEGDAKTPWLVEVTSQGLKAAKVGETARPQSFANPAAFKAWAGKRDRDAEYFVLLVKPDGIQNFFAAREFLKQMRFDIGYDLLTAEQTAIDAEKGAAAP